MPALLHVLLLYPISRSLVTHCKKRWRICFEKTPFKKKMCRSIRGKLEVFTKCSVANSIFSFSALTASDIIISFCNNLVCLLIYFLFHSHFSFPFQFPGAALTTQHKLVYLKRQKCICSLFQRPECKIKVSAGLVPSGDSWRVLFLISSCTSDGC